jgi:hypothetical protein
MFNTRNHWDRSLEDLESEVQRLLENLQQPLSGEEKKVLRLIMYSGRASGKLTELYTHFNDTKMSYQKEKKFSDFVNEHVDKISPAPRKEVLNLIYNLSALTFEEGRKNPNQDAIP